jgi:predicted ATPase with chaperone activity
VIKHHATLPLGYFTDPAKECTCNPMQIQNYTAKISGPLLDRILKVGRPVGKLFPS